MRRVGMVTARGVGAIVAIAASAVVSCSGAAGTTGGVGPDASMRESGEGGRGGDDASVAPPSHLYCEPSTADCTCVVENDTVASTPACPPSTMPHPLCCAQAGYPSTPIATCQCSNWVCNDSPVLCICSLDTTGTATGTACGNHPYCCASVLTDGSINGCTCGSFPCSDGDVPVAACSPDTITCVGPATRVPSCATADAQTGSAPPDASTQAPLDAGGPMGCSPAGALQCVSSNQFETCNADGAWSAPVACVEAACVGNTCTGVCTPYAQRCVNDGIEQCQTNGEWGAATPCNGQGCSNGACSGSCSPGALGCTGNQPATCDATGTYQPTGSACVQPAPTCSQGACSCTGSLCSGSCVDLQTDHDNCGSCGTSCAGTCTAGRCLITLAYSQELPRDIAVDATSVYWTTAEGSSSGIVFPGTVNKVPIGGGATTRLVSNGYENWAIALDDTDVFFADGQVLKVPKAGGAVTTVAGQYDTQTSLAVGATQVFFPGTNSNLIGAAPTGSAGPSLTIETTPGSYPWEVAIDATNVYWTDRMANTVSMAPRSGVADAGAGMVIATGQQEPWGIAVDASFVYWTCEATGAVMKMPVGGSSPVALASGQNGPEEMAIDATSVYWGNNGGSVMKVPIAGGTPVTLATGQGAVGGVAVDGTSVYWVSEGNATVMQATPK